MDICKAVTFLIRKPNYAFIDRHLSVYRDRLVIHGHRQLRMHTAY